MQGQTIIITGAFGVLGRKVAERAVEAGARCARIDFAPKPAAPEDPLAFGAVDLSSAAEAKSVIDAIRAKAGPIHALINIAGGFTWQTLAASSDADWERMRAMNLTTAVNASRAALPHLTETGGAIVNIGAASALKAGAGFGPYGASKAGVHKLTESLAEEMKGKVRVNAVLPSIIDTPQNRADMPDADFAAWVRPEELANVILFLVSPQASAVTGALVPVTGRV